MNNKYNLLLAGIVLIFILSITDASQDLWSEKNMIKNTFNIFWLGIFASLPAYVAYSISNYVKNSKTKFNFFLLSLILTVVSLFAWSAGILSGKAPPASGAQQMHLIFWPILIPIISLIIFVVLLVLLKCYRHFNQQT